MVTAGREGRPLRGAMCPFPSLVSGVCLKMTLVAYRLRGVDPV